MRRPFILILLLMLLILLAGCDNGSSPDSSSSLVKVSLTVGGESSDIQKAVAIDSANWASYTYQYKALHQWSTTGISGATGTIQGEKTAWTNINYFNNNSLGYFTPGPWKFLVQILDGNTLIYNGESDVIDISTSQADVTVFVAKVAQSGTAYNINISYDSYGIVEADVNPALPGELVSLYVKPSKGSQLDTLSVTWNGGTAITTYPNGNLYTFIMPAGDVTVSATFDEIDTIVDVSEFRTFVQAIHDNNPDIEAFGLADNGPSGVEYCGIGDVLMWYDSSLKKVCWYSTNRTLKFNTTSLKDFFKDSDYLRISMKGIDTSDITNMSGLFENCANLQEVDLDGVDTSKVTTMKNMFYRAGYNDIPKKGTGESTTATTPNAHNLLIKNMRFDTKKVTDMSYMFCLCSAVNLCTPDQDHGNVKPSNIDEWNTSLVTDMSYMFSGWYGKINNVQYTWYSKFASLDIAGKTVYPEGGTSYQSWNTSNCRNFSYMFDYCNRLQTIDISNWSFSTTGSNDIDMQRMFDRCEAVTSIVFPARTRLDKVKDLTYIFANCDNLPVAAYTDILSKWDIDQCSIEFVDYLNDTNKKKADTPNRITKGSGQILKGDPKTFRTWGHQNDENPNILFGGTNSNISDYAYAAQRLVLINQQTE